MISLIAYPFITKVGFTPARNNESESMGEYDRAIAMGRIREVLMPFRQSEF